MLRNPAISTAAAAEAPTGTRIVRPSTMTATLAGGASGRGRNIKTLARKKLQRGVERTGSDHRREDVGMGAGERDAAVAVGGEGAGKALGLVVDRQPVERHHPQCRPGAHDLQLAQPWEGAHRTASDRHHHVGLLADVEADILLAVAEHDAALQGLSKRGCRHRQNPLRALGYQDLTLLRPDRSGEPETRREPGVAKPG